MNKIYIFLFALLVGFSVAAEGEVDHKELPFLVGEANLNFFFWPVYEEKLFSNTKSFSYPESVPFMLELKYRRIFSSQHLYEETLRQWEAMDITPEESWLGFLEEIFPDVTKNDVISMYVSSDWHCAFYLNGQVIGSLNELNFSKAFSAIWLSEKSTRPEFRNKLMERI